MSDLLGDLSEGGAVPVETPAETPVDPAAEFLAAEQSDLAEIEQNVYDEVPQATGNKCALYREKNCVKKFS